MENKKPEKIPNPYDYKLEDAWNSAIDDCTAYYEQKLEEAKAEWYEKGMNNHEKYRGVIEEELNRIKSFMIDCPEAVDDDEVSEKEALTYALSLFDEIDRLKESHKGMLVPYVEEIAELKAKYEKLEKYQDVLVADANWKIERLLKRNENLKKAVASEEDNNEI